MGDMVVLVLQRMWSALFFSTAQKTDLDRLALDRYGLVRKPAASALTSVVFSAPTGPLANITIPVGTILATGTGQQFQTTATGIWTAGQTSSPPVPVASLLAGASQQATVNSIATITAPIAGAPANITVTNPWATAGAADQESDNDFRNRCINFPQTLLQGTLTALEQAALLTPGVQTAKAFEALNALGQQSGFVQVVIADQYTDTLAQLNQNPAAYQTQSQQLAALASLNLNGARAAGVFVAVTVAQVVLQPVVLALSFAATADVETAALQARIAVQNVINALNPGATLIPDALKNAAETVSGVIACTVTTPAGPVVPTSLQALRTSLGLVIGANQAGVPISQTTNPDAFAP